jgi:hypothetical protein
VGDRLAAYEQFLPYASAIDIELRDFDHFSGIIESAKAGKRPRCRFMPRF